jgi:preprotein translocase subunit SecD
MKNILYLIFAVIVSITLTSAVLRTTGSTKSITLQPTVNNSDPAALNKSAEIIKARLKLFGIVSSEVKVTSGNGQLQVLVPDNTDVSGIEGLFTLKGAISFYETYTHSEIADLLKSDNQLFRLLNQDQQKAPYDPRVGCTTDADHKKADEYLLAMSPVKKCKLIWGSESKKSGNCLFALKTSENGSPLLRRSDIDSVTIAKTHDMQDIKIQIKLGKAGAKIFAEATRNNIHKSIAVVFDDRVNSWPVVQDAIEGGKIEVTGDFNENEAKFFPVIFNTAEMPLSFKIIK